MRPPQSPCPTAPPERPLAPRSAPGPTTPSPCRNAQLGRWRLRHGARWFPGKPAGTAHPAGAGRALRCPHRQLHTPAPWPTASGGHRGGTGWGSEATSPGCAVNWGVGRTVAPSPPPPSHGECRLRSQPHGTARARVPCSKATHLSPCCADRAASHRGTAGSQQSALRTPCFAGALPAIISNTAISRVSLGKSKTPRGRGHAAQHSPPHPGTTAVPRWPPPAPALTSLFQRASHSSRFLLLM